MTTIIYHSRDLDGFCSGAIAKRKFPEAQLIGFDYGEAIPYDRIPKGEPIIMLDVSCPMTEMRNIARHSQGQFTWIDHHRSAIKDYENMVSELEEQAEVPFRAILREGIAACEIAWMYFFPEEEMNPLVLLLGMYDTWRNADKQNWDDIVMPVQFGMRSICTKAEEFPMCLLDPLMSLRDFQKELALFAAKGDSIIKYQAKQNEFLAKRNAFEVNFKGLRAICMNGGAFNSQAFESVYDPAKHDVMMPFQYNGKVWNFSLYTTKEEVDCSVLAKSMGGGGHQKAAGFQVSNLNDVFI